MGQSVNNYAHLLTYSDKKIISKIVRLSAQYSKNKLSKYLKQKLGFVHAGAGSYKFVLSKKSCNFVVKIYRNRKEYARKEKLCNFLQPYILDPIYQSKKIQIQVKARRDNLEVVDDFFRKLFNQNNLEFDRNSMDFKLDNFGKINDDIVVFDFWK